MAMPRAVTNYVIITLTNRKHGLDKEFIIVATLHYDKQGQITLCWMVLIEIIITPTVRYL